MAYTVKTDGMEDLSRALGKLGDAAQGVAAAGLYEGAGTIADAVSAAVQGIAPEKFHYVAGDRKRKPSPEEKAILMAASKGVAKFRKNGVTVDTSVGLANSGYAELNGKTKPIPQIANAINSGTSFMERQPFFREAVKQNEGKAVQAMDAEIQKRIDQITKNGGM